MNIQVKMLILFFMLCILSNGYTQNTISGNVYRVVVDSEGCRATSATQPMNNVTIRIYDASNNNLLATEQTDPAGFYSATVNTTEVRIVPSQDDGIWYNGVSTFDIIKLEQHLINFNILNCPFQRITADVDNSGDLTVSDADTIRRFVQNIITHFSKVPNWQFVAKNYTRTDAGNRDMRFPIDFWNNAIEDRNGNEYPFNAIYKYDASNSYTYHTGTSWMNQLHEYPISVPCDTVFWDFYAIKSGDVSHNASISFSETVENKSIQQQELYDFKVSSLKKLKPNTSYNLSIKATSKASIIGYQLAVRLNEKDLKLKEISPNKILKNYNLEQSFSTKKTKNRPHSNDIRTFWIDKTFEGKDMSAGLELFSLEIEVAQETTLDEILELAKEKMPIEFVSKDMTIVPATISLQIKE